MKTIFVSLIVMLFSSIALASTYQCDDGGALEIGIRNEDGYARASLTYQDDRTSDLDAIWFTSNPESLTGTMLSDTGDELGPVVLSEDQSTLELGYDKVNCSTATPPQEKQAGFYTNGVSASTADGASLLMTELIDNNDDHKVCYAGDYESALNNTHESISIAINDVYGEGEFPRLDVEVTGDDGRSAYGIISSCGE